MGDVLCGSSTFGVKRAKPLGTKTGAGSGKRPILRKAHGKAIRQTIQQQSRHLGEGLHKVAVMEERRWAVGWAGNCVDWRDCTYEDLSHSLSIRDPGREDGCSGSHIAFSEVSFQV